MSSGKKNYFRHSTAAFEDPKIQKAIELLGYEGYAFYFIILELCAKQCENSYKEVITIHQQTLRIVLRKSQQSCHKVVTKLQQSGLFVVTFKENCYEFQIPNLSKYMGRYENKNDSNSPNKRKEKEIKEKESKVNENKVLTGDCIAWIEAFNDAANTNFKGSAQILEQIKRHIKSGMTLDDARLVVEHKKTQWFTDEKMGKYFRPATLFGGKFANYLDDAKNSGALELESRLNELRQEFGI